MKQDLNFDQLDDTRHMLEWFHPEPIRELIASIEEILANQVSGSRLTKLHVTDKPHWLTGLKRQNENDEKGILVRVGLCFAFVLNVLSPDAINHELSGTYTWVSVNMDEPGNIKQRTWFDIDGTLEELGSKAELSNRVYFEIEE